MDLQAQTNEETEVLLSIYSGDERFRQIDGRTFQYRVESDDNSGSAKSFMLQIKWLDNYPETLPEIGMDIFYNSHLPETLKDDICAKLQEEAGIWLGSAMTYTLFEYAKENIEELFPSTALLLQSSRDDKAQDKAVSENMPPRNTQVTEDVNSGKPRGWNWMDVVKHLGQTGSGSLVSSI